MLPNDELDRLEMAGYYELSEDEFLALFAQAREANALRRSLKETQEVVWALRGDQDDLRAEIARLRSLSDAVAERWCVELEQVLGKEWLSRYDAGKREGDATATKKGTDHEQTNDT